MTHNYLIKVLALISYLLVYEINCAYAAPDKRYQKLSSHTSWLALLHYRKHFFKSWISEVDNENFFLSKHGKYSPHKELIENINHLKSNTYEYYCAFPARANWLKEHARISFEEPNCPELNKWTSSFSDKKISLLFATAYLKNPSSMFGHTLLRFSDNDENILSNTINYTANTNEYRNVLDYAYKGLTGKFSGVVTKEFFFKDLKRYNINEGRDIWEYELEFEKKDIRQIIFHTWEIKNNYFDYYFLSENCGYRILSILAIVEPELIIHKSNNKLTLPIDIIRSLESQKLIKKTKYWPSSEKNFQFQKLQLPKEQRILSYKIAKNRINNHIETLSKYNKAEQAAILALAYEYHNMMIKENKIKIQDRLSKTHQLIKARINLNNEFILNNYNNKYNNPINSHKTSRVELSRGRIDGNNYYEIGYRAAGHDLLDNILGYEQGSITEFFKINLRKKRNSDITLQEFTLLYTASFLTNSDIAKKQSWEFILTRSRKLLSNSTPLINSGELSIGKTGKLKGNNASILANIGLNYDNQFNRNHAIQTGIVLQLHGQFKKFSYRINRKKINYIDQPFESVTKTIFELSLPINTNNSLSIFTEKFKNNLVDFSDTQIRYTKHF